MVFRREKQVDSFQRQMSALRNRIGEGGPYDNDDPGGELPDYDDASYETDAGSYPVNQGGGMAEGGYSFGDYGSQGGVDLVDDDQLLVPEMPVADSQISVVSADTVWKGDITSEGSVHVYGRVEGSLTAKEDLWVAEGASVDATLTARRVVIAGNVAGSVSASERFEALPQGRVSADVTATTFVVHEGAKLNGQLKMAHPEGTSVSSYDRAGSLSVVQRRTRNAS
ncbi:MAG TPA: polymer-forming cytoskeletal protein [Thermomicrobiales bacterium]|nr:polymer-forming cytoskeletal protein [Thermomicrobiales bacterium]